MAKEDLIPMNTRPVEEARALRRKGGLSKSPRKVLASRINGLINRKGISNEMRYILANMRDRNYVEAINELISMNVEKSEDIDIRNKVIDQLQKMMPTKVMNMNINTSVDYEEFQKRILENKKRRDEVIK